MRVENVGNNEARRVEQLFGARVKALRQARGLTQEQLGERMTNAGYPMHQTTVAKLESAGRPTSVGEVAVLATLFGVPISSLFGITEGDVDAHRQQMRLHLLAVADENARYVAEGMKRMASIELATAQIRAVFERLEAQEEGSDGATP